MGARHDRRTWLEFDAAQQGDAPTLWNNGTIVSLTRWFEYLTASETEAKTWSMSKLLHVILSLRTCNFVRNSIAHMSSIMDKDVGPKVIEDQPHLPGADNPRSTKAGRAEVDKLREAYKTGQMLATACY